MKATKMTYLKVMSLLSIVLFSGLVNSSPELNRLLEDGKLKVDIYLSVEGKEKRARALYRPAVINEQIDLIVKVSSDRWFTQGTRITPFSLNHALVQQRDKLASNYTEKIRGQTWSVQEWQLAIYPLDAGRYHIPGISLVASVSLENGGSANGYIQAPSVEFDVVPPDVGQSSVITSSTGVQFDQHWNELVELKVGDAITRTLHMKAKETTVSLLPDFVPPDVVGTNVYSEVVFSNDIQNRGRYSAEKKVAHTYIVHRSGALIIPPLELDWWDTKTQTLNKAVLPGLDVRVQHTPKSWITQYWLHILVFCALMTLLVIYVRYLSRRFKQENLPSIVFFVRGVVSRDWHEAHRHLYNQNLEKTGRINLRGSVPHTEVNKWSEQHFSPTAKPREARALSVIKLWWKLKK